MASVSSPALAKCVRLHRSVRGGRGQLALVIVKPFNSELPVQALV